MFRFSCGWIVLRKGTAVRRRVALLSLLVFAVGCGSSESTTTVAGKITYNGKPVTTGLINFMAVGGKPLGGGIGQDGSYQFDLPPGEYQVRIDSPPPGLVEGAPPPPPSAKGQVPPQFASYDTSGLTMTVGADSPQQQDFALTGK